MKNKNLILDYINRAKTRYSVLFIYLENKSYADVVRESQEIVELLLKAFLRIHKIEPPRIHDVSAILQSNIPFEGVSDNVVKKFIKISKNLRRDRELAYYGSEDLTPSDFYTIDDAKEAIDFAKFVVDNVVMS